MVIIASASDQSASAGSYTIADSISSIYATLTAYSVGGATATAQFYYAIPTSSNISTTFTVSTAGSAFLTSYIAVFGGTRTATLPLESGSPQGNSGTSLPIQPGSVTPLLNGDLVVTSLAFFPGTTVSVNNGFTITDQLPGVSGTNFGGALAYLVQATAAAINPTWSLSTGTAATQSAATIAVFAHA